jgi:hypothetical protein
MLLLAPPRCAQGRLPRERQGWGPARFVLRERAGQPPREYHWETKRPTSAKGGQMWATSQGKDENPTA